MKGEVSILTRKYFTVGGFRLMCHPVHTTRRVPYCMHNVHCITTYTEKCLNFASRSNSPLFVYLLSRSTDMLWERHINCQNVKVFGQANGMLKNCYPGYQGCHGNTSSEVKAFYSTLSTVTWYSRAEA